MPKFKEGKVRKILFSQEMPLVFEKSPYAALVEKYNVKIDFFKFFEIKTVELEKFKKDELRVLDYTAIVMTSKHVIDHFFRIMKEMEIALPRSMNYFCVNEATAAYLQKYIVYYSKKRVFFPQDGELANLAALIEENKKNKFLIPCSLDPSMNTLIDLLDKRAVDYAKTEVFKVYLKNAGEAVNIYDYDMIVFFSPYGIQSLTKHYPDYKQDKTVIGAFGMRVVAAAEEAGLQVQVAAPTTENPSIFTAIDQYLEKINGTRKY